MFFFSTPSILSSKLLISAENLVFKTKLLVSIALSFVISAKLPTVFLVSPAI